MTKAPHSRCTSQVSVVVTTPSRVRLARIHAIFGAEKYGSSTRPVRRATSSAEPASAAQMDSARRSCQTIAGLSGRPVVAVPGQHGLALVGQGHGGDGHARLVERTSSRVDHRVPERLGVLLDAAPRQILGAQRDLGDRHHPAGVVDDDRLGARGALVDGQHVGHGWCAPASWSRTASIEC